MNLSSSRQAAGLASGAAESSRRRIIYESEHVRVIHLPLDAETVVVTFNEIGRCVDGLSFWGDQALAREGLAGIGVVSTRPNWFPSDPSMVSAIRIAIADHGYRRVVTYGNSQGGYGALKHAAALSADAVIAFCPQWSVSAADVAGSDDRFAQYRVPALHDAMRIEASDVAGDAFVCFDPRLREDGWNAARIAERAAVHAVLAPFTGHSGARFATQSGIGRDLLRTLAAPSPTAAARASIARRLVRGVRSSSPEYWLGRAEALAGARALADEAVRSLVRASHGAAGNADLLAGIAALYLGVGNRQQAMSYAERAAAAADPTAVHTALRIWDVMDRVGAGATSLDLMRKAVAASPENAFLRLHLVKTLLDVRAAATLEAAREVAQAASRAGESAMLWQHIEHAARMLGQEDAQLAARRRLDRIAEDAGRAQAQEAA